MKRKNVDRNDGQCFRIAHLPVWENSLSSGPSSVVLPFTLQKGHCSKLSLSPMEVESLEFALAMEVLTSYDHRTVCYRCRRLQ